MKKLSLVLLPVLLAPLSIAASAQSLDPFAGTWVMNVAKSSYPRGTCPKEMVIVMEPTKTGIHYRSKTVYPNGAVSSTEYTAGYDGKQVPVKGTGVMMPVALRRVDARTVVATYTRWLKVAATSRRVVSPTGRTMTITTSFTEESGKKLTTVGVYEKAGLAAGDRDAGSAR
jgi:hypothetical protein